MKKDCKKFFSTCVAVALASSMVFGTIGSINAQAAGVTSNVVKAVGVGEDDVVNYVSIGASQTNGYGLSGYLPITVNDGRVPDEQLPMLIGLMQGTVSKNDLNVYGYQRAPEGGYPDLIRDAFEESGYTVNLDQLAISSMRAEEVRMLLDDSYYGDSYTEWRFYDENGNGWFSSAAKEEGMSNAEALAALRKQYQTSVTNADLITYDIGVNNFGVYAINRIDSGLDDINNAKYDADFADILEGEDLETFNGMKSMVKNLVMSYAGDADAEGLAVLEYMADTFAYALIGFCANYDKSMDIIYELNPDATVVVVEIQNLMEGLSAKVPGVEGEIPLDEIYGTVVDMANTYSSVLSPYAEQIYYAEAGNVSLFLDDLLAYDGNPDSLSQDMRDCFGLYDNSLFGWELMVRYGGDFSAYPEEVVSAGVDSAYDTLATIAQLCAKQNVLDFGALDKLDSGEDALGECIETALYGSLAAGMQGQEYVIDTTALEDPDNANAMAIAVRFNIGNSFFAHPNREGHAQRANAILEALATVKEIPHLVVMDDGGHYVSLGDSLAAGKKTFSSKLATELSSQYGINEYTQLAIDGFRAEDIRYILDETYELDSYGLDNTKVQADKVREEYISAIKDADIITIAFGNDNFTTFAADQISGGNYEMDWTRYVSEDIAKQLDESFDGVYDEVLASGMDADMATTMASAIECYAYGLVGYISNYRPILNGIHELNPNAEVVVLGMFNPVDKLSMELGGGEVVLGEYINYYIQISNMFAKLYAGETANTTFVDISKTEAKMDGKTVSAYNYLISLFTANANLLPSDNGHIYIKDQILASLVFMNADDVPVVEPDTPIIPDKPIVPDDPEYLKGDVNQDGIVDDADVNLLYRGVNGYVTLTETQKQIGNVNEDGSTDDADVNLLYRYANGYMSSL